MAARRPAARCRVLALADQGRLQDRAPRCATRLAGCGAGDMARGGHQRHSDNISARGAVSQRCPAEETGRRGPHTSRMDDIEALRRSVCRARHPSCRAAPAGRCQTRRRKVAGAAARLPRGRRSCEDPLLSRAGWPQARCVAAQPARPRALRRARDRGRSLPTPSTWCDDIDALIRIAGRPHQSVLVARLGQWRWQRNLTALQATQRLGAGHGRLAARGRAVARSCRDSAGRGGRRAPT